MAYLGGGYFSKECFAGAVPTLANDQHADGNFDVGYV